MTTSTSSSPTIEITVLVQKLYSLVAQFEQKWPDRKFTPDGHLVGSLGEVLAAERYGLELLSMTEACHDARTRGGRLVQIKTTQGKSVGLGNESQHLLVLRLLPDGAIDEVYNGPGAPAWAAAGRMQRNGHRPISLARLERLMAGVRPEERIPAVTGR
jgi:hypothetical protein